MTEEIIHQKACTKCGVVKVLAEFEKLAIDHDHNTGEFRGLLCDLCNRGLGYFKDDPSVLTNAKQYLLKHRQLGLVI